MTTVYVQNSHTVSLLTLNDLISHLFPKLERYVAHHYNDLSYDMQQELIQVGMTAVWEKARRDHPATYQPGYWMGVAKFGMKRGLDDLRHETGVWVKGKQTRIENRIDYACDIAPRDQGEDGLEVAERRIYRNPGPCDPEGGRIDQRIDFEQLVETAFTLLTRQEKKDCIAVARFLATGEETAEAFAIERGWTQHHYKKMLNHLKDVFHDAAGKKRSTGRPDPIDHAPILTLYQQGYGYDRIARFVGCSKSTVQQTINKAKKDRGEIARSTKRPTQHTTMDVQRLVSA